MLLIAAVVVVILVLVLAVGVFDAGHKEIKEKVEEFKPLFSPDHAFGVIFQPGGSSFGFSRIDETRYSVDLELDSIMDSDLLSLAYSDKGSLQWTVSIPLTESWDSGDQLLGIPKLLYPNESSLTVSRLCFTLDFVEDRWKFPFENRLQDGRALDLVGIGCESTKAPELDERFPAEYNFMPSSTITIDIYASNALQYRTTSEVIFVPVDKTVLIVFLIAAISVLVAIASFILYRIRALRRNTKPSLYDKTLFTSAFLRRLENDTEMQSFV
ncbi:hypothetical protein MP638_002068 [Amoeboaphelidium occidentale]|nr:hypothetical protein MP638_002068 [Amoeboaphelidium occidentale]